MSTSSTKVVKSISRFLTSPEKVANALNWKKNSGSILGLIITRKTIDLALSSHPQYLENILHVKPIALSCHTEFNRRVLDTKVSKELETIIKIYNVCGMIVGWPLEREGWCGASCGRVLHTLDELASISSISGTDMMSVSRPICLYDTLHHCPQHEDEWGRSPMYSETTNELEVHISSARQDDDSAQEQSVPPSVSLLLDFCNTNWPNHMRDENDFIQASGRSEIRPHDKDFDDYNRTYNRVA